MSVCNTQFSWIFDPNPTLISSLSPLRVEQNQTEDFSFNFIFPIIFASSATNTLS